MSIKNSALTKPLPGSGSELCELIERLRPALDRMPIACVCNDTEFRFVYWNSAAERVFGYSFEEVRGTHPFDSITPRSVQPFVKGLFERLAAGDMSANGSGINLTKDRGEIVCEWINTPLIGAHGRFVGLMSMCQDITERIRADQALKEREALFRAIYENANNGIMLTDLEGRFLKANPMWCQIIGYSEEQLTGKRLNEVTPAEDRPVVEAGLVKLIEEGRYAQEQRYVRADGKIIWAGVNSSLVRDGEGEADYLVGVVKDITARKEIEEMLRHSQRKYQELVETSNDLIWSLDLDGRIGYVNRLAAKRILGSEPEEAIGRRFVDLLPLKEAERMLQVLERIRQGYPCFNHETQVFRKDGSLVEISFNFMALTDAEGRVAGSTVTGSDITERKGMEEMLRRSQKKYQHLVETSNDLIWTVDSHGRWTFVNRIAANRILGYEPEDLLGRPFTDFQPLEQARKDLETFERVKAGHPVFQYETVMIRKDGTIVDLAFNAIMMVGEDGVVSGATGSASDISERKRSQREIEERSAFARLLQVAAVAANEATEISDAIRPCLKAVCEQLGCEIGHALLAGEEEGNLLSAGLWHSAREADFADFRSISESIVFSPGMELPGRVLECARPLFIEDICLREDCARAGAARRYGLHGAFALPVLIGNEVVAVLEFLSSRKLRLDQGVLDVMSQIGTQLGRAVERQRATEKLRHSEEQLRQSQKMEAMGRLAGGVAHDFNNLLTAINGYSELVLRALKGESQMRLSVMEIKKAGERAASLTEQLLAFSRRQVLRSELIDLNALVHDMDKMLRRLIGDDIQLVTDLDPALWRVRANTGQLEQVVMNLAVNARDAMPKGGRLTITTSNEPRSSRADGGTSYLMSGEFVRLAVVDTGCGMTEETMQHVFEPFFTTKEKGKGTGLGLSTVYGIIKQNRGHIHVASQPGRGAVFDVYLPKVDEAPAQEMPTQPDIRALSGSETVLVVEDDDAVRRLVVSILEMHGYEVFAAADALEGIALSETSGRIHLLVTDVVMRYMSGRELAEQLEKRRPEMRVIYMSGYTDDAIVQHGVQSSNFAFLGKPFSPEALLKKAREVLDEAGAQSP